MNHMKYRGFTRIYAVVLSVMMLMAMIPWSAGAETMHTVTFVTGGHIADVPSQQVADGACVANPGIAYDSQAADYSTTGLWFDWWFVEDPSPSFTTHDLGYTVEDGGKRYDFNLPLTRDLTLYAGYRAAQNYGVYDLTNSREYYGGKIRIVSPYNPNVSFTNGSGGTYANTGTRATVSIQVSEGYHFVGLSTSKSRDDIFTTDEEYAYIIKQRTSNYALFEVGEAVSKPRFSLASGEYNGTQKVEITCATDGAKIYYTTDGTDPSASSTEYTGEITVSASMKLKAVGVKEGYLNRCVFLGDSRTVGMEMFVGGREDEYWSAKNSMGYSWLVSSGAPAVENLIDENTDVVILMGVNDLGNVSRYVDYMNAKAADWKERGARTFFVSVTPVVDSKSPNAKNQRQPEHGGKPGELRRRLVLVRRDPFRRGNLPGNLPHYPLLPVSGMV